MARPEVREFNMVGAWNRFAIKGVMLADNRFEVKVNLGQREEEDAGVRLKDLISSLAREHTVRHLTYSSFTIDGSCGCRVLFDSLSVAVGQVIGCSVYELRLTIGYEKRTYQFTCSPRSSLPSTWTYLLKGDIGERTITNVGRVTGVKRPEVVDRKLQFLLDTDKIEDSLRGIVLVLSKSSR